MITIIRIITTLCIGVASTGVLSGFIRETVEIESPAKEGFNTRVDSVNEGSLSLKALCRVPAAASE